MKIATHNIQGLNNPDKLKALWKWLLMSDIDVLCLQEHKLHDQTGKIQHCNGYTLFYGGSSSYSGTLNVVKDKFKPTSAINHASGRILTVQIESEFGSINICNVYGYNAATSRGDLWDFLTQTQSLVGIVCGDFNMVEGKEHSATGAAVMQAGERTKWDLLKSTHLLIDAWDGPQRDKGYTYHSQAYARAWSRLDRIYIVSSLWCPPVMDILVDYQNSLSDHFPIIATFSEYDWQAQMIGCSVKRPLIVNNLMLHKSLFQNSVSTALSYVSALQVSASDKWVQFLDCMQKVIRSCGKHYAQQSRMGREQ